MNILQLEVPQVELIHRQTDHFKKVFELKREDGSAFEEEVDLAWVFQQGSTTLLTLQDGDISQSGNEIAIEKDFDFFLDFSRIEDYTHRLFDRTTNETLFEGPFKIV